MADERLRLLERRWRTTKSVPDEIAYLRERLRLGALTQVRLDLAAHLGHPAALELASKPQPQRSASPGGWARDLTEWGIEPPLWAGLTATAVLFEAELDPGIPDAYRAKVGEACARVVAWLREPSAANLARAVALDTGWDAFELIKVLATLERVGPERVDVAIQEAARHGKDVVDKALIRLSENAVRRQLGQPPIQEVSVSAFPPVPEPVRSPAELAEQSRYAKRAARVEARVAARLRDTIALRLLNWALA